MDTCLQHVEKIRISRAGAHIVPLLVQCALCAISSAVASLLLAGIREDVLAPFKGAPGAPQCGADVHRLYGLQRHRRSRRAEEQCQFGAVTLKGDLARIDPDKCTGCGACAQECPVKVISGGDVKSKAAAS